MDVTEATFDDEVIARSREVPVVVDFWAGWCQPCRQLAPIIETAVERRAGEVVLAKVDIDANPGLAQRYQVMSIPAVKAFKGGAMVAEFVGVQPPAAVEAFLDRIAPSEADRLVMAGDEESLRQAMKVDPGHVAARVHLARLLFGEARPAEVEDILAPIAHDPDAAGLLSRARLVAADSPDVQAALSALARGDREVALTHFLDAIRGLPRTDDESRDLLREAVVGIFRELGDQHPLTLRFRPRLARALY